MFNGSICALITPFRDGDVDEKAFGELVNWQIDEGTHGLVVAGRQAKSPTLSHDEHKRVVEICIEVADKACSRDCRRRIEFDSRGGRIGRTRQAGWRRCRTGRHTLLQQADPGGVVSAF